MNTDEIDYITHKANELEADDKTRRGLLEWIGRWWASRKASRRRKAERKIEKRAKRIAY